MGNKLEMLQKLPANKKVAEPLHEGNKFWYCTAVMCIKFALLGAVHDSEEEEVFFFLSFADASLSLSPNLIFCCAISHDILSTHYAM